MGAGEERSPAKPSKSPSSTQETAPVTPSYADWSNSMQAYYGAGAAPPFFPIASPPPHPYMWGGQHPLMPPYGTPVPYPALYPLPEYMRILIWLRLLALYKQIKIQK